MFTYERAERLQGSGVTVNAVHPGPVRTGFGSEFVGPFGFLMKIARPFIRSPEKGAETVIYLAASPEVEGRTGLYWKDRKPIRSIASAYDELTRRRLWDASEQLTGLAGTPGPSLTPRGESDARAEQ
jgi:retinol dehydrogenase 14